MTLHAWRLPPGAAVTGRAFLRLAADPARLRRLPGVRFAKLLGTGHGTTFGPGDADLSRFAAIICWAGDDPGDLGAPGRAWDDLAHSSVRAELVPLTARGHWSGQSPFIVKNPAPEPRVQPPEKAGTATTTKPGATSTTEPGTASTTEPGTAATEPGASREDGGPLLSLTRARLRPTKALGFWRSIPPVAREVTGAPGLLAAFGIGEAPVGWQGTISVWRGAADLAAFAYRQPEHRTVIARTPAVRWYAEELFARFAVRAIHGDRAVLGWREGER